MIFIRYQV